MLLKKFRLSGKVIKQQMRKSRSFSVPFCTMLVAKNALSYNRYGSIISKKVDKRAVARNRIRRMCYDCIAGFLESINQGYDIMFIFKSSVRDIPKENFCKSIEGVLKKGLVL